VGVLRITSCCFLSIDKAITFNYYLLKRRNGADAKKLAMSREIWRMQMTKGFNPRTGKWQESIEKSAGQRRKRDPESETMRKVQEMLKQRKRSK